MASRGGDDVRNSKTVMDRAKRRIRRGLLSSMRVIYRDRTLEIGQVNERERLWIHDIICTERRPA
jgi:hypothetical protein